MHSNYIIFLVLMTIYCTAACQTIKTSSTETSTKEKTSTQQPINSGQIEDSWLVFSMHDGEKEYDFDMNKYYNFRLDKGKIQFTLDVNSCGGSFALAKNIITVQPDVFCSEYCCDSEQGQAFARLLPNIWTWTIDGNMMTWKAGKKELVFLKESDPQLINTGWQAVHMVDKKGAKYLFTDSSYGLYFSNQNSIKLQLGQSRCVTQFLQEGQTLTFPMELFCDRKCCPDTAPNQLKNYFKNSLNFEIKNDQLTLSNDEVELLFQRIND